MDVESAGDEEQLSKAGRADGALVPLNGPSLESGALGEVVL